MEGYFFAKEGVRARRAGGPIRQLDADAPRHSALGIAPRAPRFASPTDPAPSVALIKDDQAIFEWLQSIPVDERPAFLRRVASTVERMHQSTSTSGDARREDALYSFALLLEYAAHLGFSRAEVCSLVEQTRERRSEAQVADGVDQMLADAAGRRAHPGRPAEAPSAPVTATRGLSGHWRKTFRRRGAERRAGDRIVVRGAERLLFQRVEPTRGGRAG